MFDKIISTRNHFFTKKESLTDKKNKNKYEMKKRRKKKREKLVV